MGSTLSSYVFKFQENDHVLNYYYPNIIYKKNPCIDPSLNKVSFNSTIGNAIGNTIDNGIGNDIVNDTFKFYKLFIYIDPSVSNTIKKMYEKKAFDNNMLVDSYLESYSNVNASDFCYDAGFDLFCPENHKIKYEDGVFMLDHKIKCCMKVSSQDSVIEHYVGYYLYCRSSTGLKTPLRLANSLGIIDSGYRGNIKACFDYVDTINFKDGFNLESGCRYTQICPPNLEHPMKIYIVDNIEDLGNSTLRDSGGFGSSGN
jgi:dUTP pyrophosphatase